MIFKRRKPDPLREAEELLREMGWQRVSGEGRESIWSLSGFEWLPFEVALDELAHSVAPDPDEEQQRWLT